MSATWLRRPRMTAISSSRACLLSARVPSRSKAISRFMFVLSLMNYLGCSEAAQTTSDIDKGSKECEDAQMGQVVGTLPSEVCCWPAVLTAGLLDVVVVQRVRVSMLDTWVLWYLREYST